MLNRIVAQIRSQQLPVKYLGTKGFGAAAAKMLASRDPAMIYITGHKEAAPQHTLSDFRSTGTKDKLV
ncbi:hypothetical protein VM1G_11436 [Cytospora mali]|uniref:Uncharacterized protein n=1 Tax=Cytospora mali TaxID=578113 RepID=A0A194VPJ7_CYTMA|nr:hypothetical protein VM1G_11436 [Valsa mali]